MGNWMTVNVMGSCNSGEVSALKEALEPGDDYKNFHCLCNTGGLCGLGNWAAEEISAIGNLAERDYTIDSVVEELEKLSQIVPSLKVKIHCGGDYESKNCVATVICENGKVSKREPEIEKLMAIPGGQIKGNLLGALMKR